MNKLIPGLAFIALLAAPLHASTTAEGPGGGAPASKSQTVQESGTMALASLGLLALFASRHRRKSS